MSILTGEPTTPRGFLTKLEAARYLGVSKDTIQRADKAGKLKGMVVPGRGKGLRSHKRYALSDLEAMARERK